MAVVVSDFWAHSHWSWHSFGHSRNAGGLITFIKKSWTVKATNIFSLELCPGRILVTIIMFEKFVYVVANVYFDPKFSRSERVGYLTKMNKLLAGLPSSCSFIIGVVNFAHSSTRVNVGELIEQQSAVHRTLQKTFEECCPDFTEIAHDVPSFMRGTYVSTIDRFFIRVPAMLVNELQPKVRPLWQFGDPLGGASDHVGVAFEIGFVSGKRIRSIPSWVCKHPDFERVCNDKFAETRYFPCDPLQKLLKVKSTLVTSAWKTREVAAYASTNLNLAQQIYWSVQALRSQHDCNSKAAREACRRYPYLLTFICLELNIL